MNKNNFLSNNANQLDRNKLAGVIAVISVIVIISFCIAIYYFFYVVPLREIAERCANAIIEPNANLSGCNYSEKDFSNLDLSGVNFTTANLSNTNLAGANLFGANLTRANLQNANITNANLAMAIFDHVNPINVQGLTNTLIESVQSWIIDPDEVKIIYFDTCNNSPFSWAPEYVSSNEHNTVAIITDNWGPYGHEDSITAWKYTFTLPIKLMDIRDIDSVACIYLDDILLNKWGLTINGSATSRGAFQHIVKVQIITPKNGIGIINQTFYGSKPDSGSWYGTDNSYGSEVSKSEIIDWISRILNE